MLFSCILIEFFFYRRRWSTSCDVPARLTTARPLRWRLRPWARPTTTNSLTSSLTFSWVRRMECQRSVHFIFRINEPLCCWWLIWPIQYDVKNPEKWLKPWQMGTHLRVLSESYPTWQDLDGFQKSLLPRALEENSFSIGRVKVVTHIGNQNNLQH